MVLDVLANCGVYYILLRTLKEVRGMRDQVVGRLVNLDRRSGGCHECSSHAKSNVGALYLDNVSKYLSTQVPRTYASPRLVHSRAWNLCDPSHVHGERAGPGHVLSPR